MPGTDTLEQTDDATDDETGNHKTQNGPSSPANGNAQAAGYVGISLYIIAICSSYTVSFVGISIYSIANGNTHIANFNKSNKWKCIACIAYQMEIYICQH